MDFNIGVGFKAGLKVAKNIKKLLIIPTYQVCQLVIQIQRLMFIFDFRMKWQRSTLRSSLESLRRCASCRCAKAL